MSDPSATADSADEAERQLLDRLRAGEAAAFETLIRLHGGRLLATARRMLRSDDDAADAVQECYVAAFRHLAKFEGASRLGTWLHRILINACLMKLRSRGRHPEAALDSLLPAYDSTGHHARHVPAWRKLPDEELQSAELRDLVRATIDRLPEDFRSILVLRDLEELSTEDAAAALEISPGAAKVRLHRARQALRTLLEPHLQR